MSGRLPAKFKELEPRDDTPFGLNNHGFITAFIVFGQIRICRPPDLLGIRWKAVAPELKNSTKSKHTTNPGGCPPNWTLTPEFSKKRTRGAQHYPKQLLRSCSCMLSLRFLLDNQNKPRGVSPELNSDTPFFENNQNSGSQH